MNNIMSVLKNFKDLNVFALSFQKFILKKIMIYNLKMGMELISIPLHN